MVKNFKEMEFACKCGCGASLVSPTIQLLCQLLRDTYEVPVRITSAVRCKEHNENVGGAKASQHVPDLLGIGHAVDVVVSGVDPVEVYAYLDDMFPSTLGLGLYNNWVHIDDRLDASYRWDKS